MLGFTFGMVTTPIMDLIVYIKISFVVMSYSLNEIIHQLKMTCLKTKTSMSTSISCESLFIITWEQRILKKGKKHGWTNGQK